MNNLKELFSMVDNRKKPSELVERKWESAFDIDEWEIETDTGWQSISKIGKTIPYEVWEIETSSGKKLKCADTHIVFNESYQEIFVKDLNKDTRPDKIITKDGPERVVNVKNLGYAENMYDIQVDHEDHRFWTSDILSHNSIWLANDAVNYVRAGHDVAVITAEMADIDFIHRIGANMLNVKVSEYEKLSKQPGFIKQRLSQLTNGVIPPGNLYVKEYPTSQATVPEIESYLRELETLHGIKLKVVIIDYINILSNFRNANSENTYMKIKQIAEDLRAMAVRNEWVVISATQINRGGYDSTELNMGHIAESAGLSHTADMIYGIIQDSSMHMNNEYWLKILKVRNGTGKNSRCMYRIDYSYMRLIETDTVINTNN
jgi:hypothetical protein